MSDNEEKYFHVETHLSGLPVCDINGNHYDNAELICEMLNNYHQRCNSAEWKAEKLAFENERLKEKMAPIRRFGSYIAERIIMAGKAFIKALTKGEA